MTTKKAKKTVKAKKPAVKKNGLITIPSPVNPDVHIVVASEMADDQMIEQELMGEIAPHFVYQFQQEGKPVVGLTVKGVNEVVRRINRQRGSESKIHISPQYITKEEVEREGQKGIEVSVFAEDLVSGNSAWGIKFEPYFKEGRNGKYRNTFAVEKALSKAERNAKRKLIPEVLATKMIQKLITEAPTNVKKLEAPSGYEYVRVEPATPKASSPEELTGIIVERISKLTDVSQVISFDERAQQDKRLSKEQKALIHKTAVSRATEIENGDKK